MKATIDFAKLGVMQPIDEYPQQPDIYSKHNDLQMTSLLHKHDPPAKRIQSFRI